jgi:hypothetical protein
MNNSENQSTVTLYPKRSSAVWLFLGCAAFVAIGIWMGVTENWIGFLIAAFAGLGLAVAAVQLLPGSTYLQVDRSGFTFCNLFRRTTVPWSIVEEFFVVTIKQTGMKVHEMVGFNFVESYDKALLGRRIASFMGQCEGALPDTYGMKADELASFMNECLAKVKTNGGEQTPAGDVIKAAPDPERSA